MTTSVAPKTRKRRRQEQERSEKRILLLRISLLGSLFRLRFQLRGLRAFFGGTLSLPEFVVGLCQENVSFSRVRNQLRRPAQLRQRCVGMSFAQEQTAVKEICLKMLRINPQCFFVLRIRLCNLVQADMNARQVEMELRRRRLAINRGLDFRKRCIPVSLFDQGQPQLAMCQG